MNMLNLPKKVYFKDGSMNVALRELSEVYHLKRAFLVSDPGLYRSSIVMSIDCWLRDRGIRTAEFTADDGFHLNGKRMFEARCPSCWNSSQMSSWVSAAEQP